MTWPRRRAARSPASTVVAGHSNEVLRTVTVPSFFMWTKVDPMEDLDGGFRDSVAPPKYAAVRVPGEPPVERQRQHRIPGARAALTVGIASRTRRVALQPIRKLFLVERTICDRHQRHDLIVLARLERVSIQEEKGPSNK